ncbi:hypothetical protein ACN47E_000262 [Coniothyrium glycines]
MAQTQLLYHRPSPTDLRQGFSTPQPGSLYCLPNCLSGDYFGYSMSDSKLAQASLQYQRHSESNMRAQHAGLLQRSSHTGQARNQAFAHQAQPESTQVTHQLWASYDADGTKFWPSGLPSEPGVMTDTDQSFKSNGDLTYDQVAAQSLMLKNPYNLDGEVGWIGNTGKDMTADMEGSALPFGHSKDTLENAFARETMSNQLSHVGSWQPDVSFGTIEGSSPMGKDHTQEMIPQHKVGDYSEPDYLGYSSMALEALLLAQGRLDHLGFEHGTGGGILHEGHLLGRPHGMSSGYTTTQEGDCKPDVWSGQAYYRSPANQPTMAQDTQARQNPCVGAPLTASSATSDDDQKHFQTGASPSTSRDERAQTQYRPRFQVPQCAGTQSQRQTNDRILLNGKARGLTYKEIRKDMIGEAPAESTLRGRYRSLTKERRDRVRKPVWTPRDVQLLERRVALEFDRIDNTISNPRSLSVKQRLVKVPWKKVAEHIASNGGSYHFGNSTCKRKWLELHADSN